MANNIQEINKVMKSGTSRETVIETCIEGNYENATKIILRTATQELVKIRIVPSNIEACKQNIAEILEWTRNALSLIGQVDALPAHMRSVDAYLDFNKSLNQAI